MVKLNYKEDKYLNFLSKVDNRSLDVLVKILTEDKDGNLRTTEVLTSQERYKKYNPNHSKYWDLIAAEYQYFGGNTIVNGVRQSGVLYEEILADTCEDMKVDLPKNASVEIKEKALLSKVLEDSLDKMSNDDKKELLKNLNYKGTDFTKQAILGTLQMAIKTNNFMAYKFAVIIANAIAKKLVGHGLSFAANASLTNAMSVMVGPVGIAFTVIWTAIDLAGPGKRVTIPATIYIAALRQEELNRQAYEKAKEEEYTKLKAKPFDLKNKWFLLSLIVLLLSISFYIYTFFSSTNMMNKEIRMFDKNQMVFQKVFFDKYLIYGNVFENRNEKRDKFTRQIIMYVSGIVEVSANTDKLKFDEKTGKVIYKTKDKEAPFDVAIHIPEKNIKIIDNIYPKSIDLSDSVAIASVLGIAGATVGASVASKWISPIGKLTNLQNMAVGSVLGGVGGIAMGLSTKGIRLKSMLGVRQKDEIIVKAEELIAYSLKNDKRMNRIYKNNFSKILNKFAEKNNMKFSGVVYESE